MTQTLQKIDTQVLADSVVPPVTEEDAQKALEVCDLKNVINLKKWKAGSTVGQFLAHEVHGSIMTDCAINRAGLSRLRTILFEKLKSKNTKTFEMAGKMLLELCRTQAETAELELKLGEVMARRGTKLEAGLRAPDIAPKEAGNHIHANNVQVIIEAGQPQIEKKTGEA